MKIFFVLSIIASIFYFFGKKKKISKLKKLGIGIFVLAFIMLISSLTGLIKTEEILQVKTEKVERRSIIETVSASGKIQPEVEVKISPDVSGEIVELLIKEGDRVEKGDLLLKIKPDIYKSILERSKASVNTAKANLAKSNAQLTESKAKFNRNKRLYNQDAISLSEFEQIEAAYKVAELNVESSEYAVSSAEASLNEAEENLDKTSIYAPVDGTISRLNVELGERVVGTGQMSGTELMRLANLSAMEVAVEVNENDIVRVHLGDTSLIEVDAFLGEEFKGIVTEIANSANVSGVSADQVTNFEVKIRILDKTMFRPGMTASVEVQTNLEKNVISVPIQAVTTRKDTAKNGDNKKVECVFLFENEMANFTIVKTGIQNDNFIQVLEGISDSDVVITGPYTLISKTLKDGTKVESIEEEKDGKNRKSGFSVKVN
ncbi:MAG: efflux RND transporter periplasmic adaptor subunit [Flavobacteriales bacterium]|nr:efflux RND transporter periplasmic adaptor subunit [Flavobacteriales bacterium]